MSKTQQEIATPQVCKWRYSPVMMVVMALIFIVGGLIGCLTALNDNLTVMLIVIFALILCAIALIIPARKFKFTVMVILELLALSDGSILFCFILNGNNIPNAITTIVALIIVMAGILAITLLSERKKQERSTKYLTYAATFVALSIICKMLGNAVSSVIVIPNMRLSFVYIPWVMSGIVLGPIGGMVTALLSDVLGQITVAVGGAVNPLTTLSNTLFPLAPALIFKYLKCIKKDSIKLAIGMAISLLLCTMGLGAAALYFQYGYNDSMSFFTYVLTIRSPQIIVISINYFLILLLMPVLHRLKLVKAKFDSENAQSDTQPETQIE